MKRVELGQASIDDAQQERVVILRHGKPVALVIGIDQEQLDLESSGEFWKLVAERRREPTISRAELDRRLGR